MPIGAGGECPMLTLLRKYTRPLLIDEKAESLDQRQLQIHWIIRFDLFAGDD